MRSLPVFPLLLLLLGALLSTGDSWAGTEQDDKPVSPTEADESESSTPEKSKTSKGTKAPESSADRRARLTKERSEVMSELLALEEGYSELKGLDSEDSDEVEARLSGRLTLLQTRLDRLDLELAKGDKAKR